MFDDGYDGIFSQVHNGTISPYVDPDAPVHIVTGSAVRKSTKCEDECKNSLLGLSRTT